MAFLKPRTAWPRSEPTVRNFLAPNTTRQTTRIPSSSRIPMPLITYSRLNSALRVRNIFNHRPNESDGRGKFGTWCGRSRCGRRGLQPEGDGAVIDQGNLHVRAEYS